MKKIKSEKGSITLFVIVAFIFCLTMLVGIYWTNTNNQVMILQAKQRINEIYRKDLDSAQDIYEHLDDPV